MIFLFSFVSSNYLPQESRIWLTIVEVSWFYVSNCDQNSAHIVGFFKGLVQFVPSLYSGWGFLTSKWDRQMKFSANAEFGKFWSLTKFYLGKTQKPIYSLGNFSAWEFHIQPEIYNNHCLDKFLFLHGFPLLLRLFRIQCQKNILIEKVRLLSVLVTITFWVCLVNLYLCN